MLSIAEVKMPELAAYRKLQSRLSGGPLFGTKRKPWLAVMDFRCATSSEEAPENLNGRDRSTFWAGEQIDWYLAQRRRPPAPPHW
jgi:hypothetical protein